MAEATKIYELTVLYHPDLESSMDKAEAKLTKTVQDEAGKVLKTTDWGKKKLAYTIKKQDYAVYRLYDIEISPAGSNVIQAKFNITDEIIRYLVVEKDPRMDEEKQKTDAEAEDKPAKKTTKPKEAEEN